MAIALALSMAPRRRLTTTLVFLCFIAGYVNAQVEVTVDDDDPAIVYTPELSWFRNEEVNPMDAGGFHMVTTDIAASATFRFTGTGISYMAPLWAEEITTQVRLDGGVPVIIDLQDKTVPAEVDGATTVESSVLWSEKGLANTEHILIINVAPGGRFAVVDQLLVEQDGPAETTETTIDAAPTETETETAETETSTTTSRTRPPAVTSPTASPTPGTTTGLTITIAVVCSVAAALIFLFVLLFFLRRRRQRREREAWGKVDAAPPPPPMDMVDDGINAPPKQRFRSIPSRNSTLSKLYTAGDESPDNISQVNTPTASGKAASKLRQVVVASEDGNRRQSWVPHPEIVQTSRT